MATSKGCTPSQLALAWVHHQGDDVCPIPGTTKIDNFNDNIGALSVKLTSEEMTQLSTLANLVKGDRNWNFSMLNTWKTADTPPLSSWKGEVSYAWEYLLYSKLCYNDSIGTIGCIKTDQLSSLFLLFCVTKVLFIFSLDIVMWECVISNVRIRIECILLFLSTLLFSICFFVSIFIVTWDNLTKEFLKK